MIEADFLRAMEEAGLSGAGQIRADGKLHRFRVEEDRRGTLNGWYVLHSDPPVGAFGCWKRGIEEKWSGGRGDELTSEERERIRRQVARAKAQREREEQKKREEAAERAEQILETSQPAPPDHPYLEAKQVEPYGLRLEGFRLVVPIRDAAGRLQSLQHIGADGQKLFLEGGQVRGGLHLIGELRTNTKLIVCEGYATGATLHKELGLPVAVAFNAGNLEPVAKALRSTHPEAKLIIAADNDHKTEGNPGKRKAEAAAAAVGARVVVPSFPEGSEGSDFNDLAAELGAEAVREAFAPVTPVTPPDVDQVFEHELARLAALQPLQYERERKAAAELLEIRAGVLDKIVKARRSEGKEGGLFLEDPDPWPDDVNGAELLDEITAAVRRHVSLPAGASEAVALWILHSHAHEASEVSPILAVTSPTPECGKTTQLTFLQGTVRRPLPASNITAAALFRAVEKYEPTLLIDEADTFLRDSDDLRGVLNSGHARAGAYVIRTVGDQHEPTIFRTWAPKAIALIGKLPPTLASRSIHVELKRLAPGESVEPLRLHRVDLLEPLQRKASRWAADALADLRGYEPELPPELYGRAADNWRALLSIADKAGGEWPDRARTAAVTLSAARSEQTAGVLLLEDLRRLFSERGDRLSTSEILEALNGMDDRPWPEWSRGKELTSRGLGKLLYPFGVTSRTVRLGTGTAKGFQLEQLEDAFRRYLPPSVTVTPSHPADRAENGHLLSDKRPNAVTDTKPRDPACTAACDGVSDREPPPPEESEAERLERLRKRYPNRATYPDWWLLEYGDEEREAVNL